MMRFLVAPACDEGSFLLMRLWPDQRPGAISAK